MNLRNKAYGPGATLAYEDQAHPIVATWGPTIWQQQHQTMVRGVSVSQLEKAVVDDRNIGYARCAFPDGTIRSVNAGNIRIIKVKGNAHTIK